MHSRRDVGITDEAVFPIAFDLDDDGLPVVANVDNTGTRRSWRETCAATRSIECIHEEKILKAQLADTFVLR
jgi:hypothetical protein